MRVQVQVFNYKIVEELPQHFLLQTQYFNHRRLGVFARKGCKCVSCGLEGRKLLRCVDKTGAYHVDMYSDDLWPITVDHIIPISKGGEDTWENKQPMCSECNRLKGDKILT